jgi:ASCH domain
MRGGAAIGLPAVKALTLRQPWAWATIYGGKDVENRRWKTRHRGPLLIHAGVDVDPDGSASVLKTIADPDVFARPRTAWEARGAIIGLVFLADILTDSPSRWAIPGRYHWALEFPSPIDPPILHRGRPGLWVPPAAVVWALRDIL